MENRESESNVAAPVANKSVNGHSIASVGEAKVIEVNFSRDPVLNSLAVVKRSGMLVPFRADRIVRAIEAAFRESRGIGVVEALAAQDQAGIQQVTKLVAEECKKQAKKGASLTVEGIQDIVEVKLMECGYYEVARNYIVYRDDRKSLREDSPRNIKVMRRDAKAAVRFNPMKIASAIEKAFRANLKIETEDQTPQDIVDAVNLITNKVVRRAVELSRTSTVLNVEMIQDLVEQFLMSEGFYKVAKDYILYRAERARLRSQAEAHTEVERQQAEKAAPIVDQGRVFLALDRHGKEFQFSEADFKKRIDFACSGLEKLVSPKDILGDSFTSFYDGIKTDEIDQSAIMAAKAKIEIEPAYTYVSARLLLDVIYREAFDTEAYSPKVEELHHEYFKQYIVKATELGRIDAKLQEFDLDKLANAMQLERDAKFTYLGLQTLYDRYLIHNEDVRLETPQIFWMRVAMGLSVLEGKHKNERAIEFYNVLSQFLFVSSTPTLFNSGTLHPQLSSCYLSTVMDDLKHIFKCVADDAQLSKWAGGLGNDWTNVRATGARIKGTNGRSQGVIPFLKVANDTANAVNQGGKRKGAMCAYIETWHLDIEDFLELRKNTGDERRRTHDMNTANWIPDLFMKRVATNGTWTLFSPSDVPDLHDLYGTKFEKRYEEYEKQAEAGTIKLFKKIEALQLWRRMLSMLFETGHPWITFKDPSNIRSPQDHVGVVHSSNLCTEILLNTSVDETAVCNLGSVNLVEHTTATGLNEELLAKTVQTAVRMLDNVIDINFYPIVDAQNSNMKHRPIGLGFMGFQDALYVQNLSYGSPKAVEFADSSMEMISYYAILASSELAKERGTYSTYKGSKWDRGLLPIDTLDLLEKERGGSLEVDRTVRKDWSKVRESVKKHGMRNSNTMAIAPTATISNITGVSQSIEPYYKHLFVKSNLSGEFTVPNIYLVEDLKKLGIWDADMLDDLKYFDGSIIEIERIPEEIRRKYLTAFEIEPEWLIECASRRQKWIDMGQSLNLYLAEPSGKKLHDMYLLAWRKGLKTTYYLRSLAATQIEKSTTDINKRGLQPRWMKNKSASSNIVVDREAEIVEAKPQTPKVCGLDGECESCQ